MGLFQAPALCIAFFAEDGATVPLAESVFASAILGGILALTFRDAEKELSNRAALLLVSLAWFGAGVLGALPFYLSSNFPSFTDAVFESVSGFTTTGASILSNVEALPASLHFWRAFTHWLGGLGIILFMIAILPLVGSQNIFLYRTEFSGARSERLQPRLSQVARSLWRIYTGFTIAGFVALLALGLTPLDSICQTFGAIGTGGFSTKNASVESFHSVGVEVVLIVLMVIGGINFSIHYLWIFGKRAKSVFRDTETRVYLILLLASSLLIAVDLAQAPAVKFLPAFRMASFQVVSIMTATGFSSADFGQWSSFAQFLLLTLMFVGGCTGSTAGGLKVARIVLLFKTISAEFRQMSFPRVINHVQMDRKVVPPRELQPVLSVVLLAVILHLVASLLLVLAGSDLITSTSAVTACMFNVGPGLNAVGPASNYGHLAALAKWVLIFVMIAGRLEFFSLLVLFTPNFWKS